MRSPRPNSSPTTPRGPWSGLRCSQALLASLVIGATSAHGQSEQSPRQHLEAAMSRMGGASKLRKLRAVSIRIQSGGIRELHRVRLKDRLAHYLARRPSGNALEIVLARGSAFAIDRSRDGAARQIEDLNPDEVREAGYDRDLYLLPMLLPQLLDRDDSFLKDAGTTPNGDRLVEASLSGQPDSKEQSVRYTLRFSERTKLLVGARSAIPAGPDAGRMRTVAFSGYVALDGVLLPRELRRRTADGPIRGVQFDLSFEKRLPMSLFVKPRAPASPNPEAPPPAPPEARKKP